MEMLNQHCGIDRDPRGVVRLTICNAGALNILGSDVINGVREGLTRLATDRTIRVLVMAGRGEKSMIGGADIKDMAGLDQKSAEAFITRLRDLCEAVRSFPAPVIARMPGWCLGGGLEVAAACDFRIAAHDAKFGMPEVRVGIPSVIHAALLPRLIGWGRARWLVMTAENIDAPTALSWGLVDVVAPQGGLDAAVEHTVQQLGRIDILVNNAGIFDGGPLEEMTVAQAIEAFIVDHAEEHLAQLQTALRNLAP